MFNDYHYGNYDSINGYPLSFSFKRKGEDLVVGDVRIGFDSTQDVSLPGINAYSTPQDIVAVLGTPDSVGSVRKDNNNRTQSLTWDEMQIGDANIEYISIQYKNGYLDYMRVTFAK